MPIYDSRRLQFLICIQGHPEGEYGQIFEKNESRLNLVKDTFSKSTFDADAEYDISFEINSIFLDENMLKNGQKHRKTMKNTVFSDILVYIISARVYYF